LSKLIQNFCRWKNDLEILADFVIKKTAKSKYSPIWRKVAQSDHPGHAHRFIFLYFRQALLTYLLLQLPFPPYLVLLWLSLLRSATAEDCVMNSLALQYIHRSKMVVIAIHCSKAFLVRTQLRPVFLTDFRAYVPSSRLRNGGIG
jgi:hypothetical protein